MNMFGCAGSCILVLIVLLSSMMPFCVEGGSFADVELLYNNVMNGYNKDIRPLETTYTPIVVECSFQLVAIKELNEVTGKLSVVGFFEIAWNDRRIRWDPYAHNHTYTIELPESLVWTPEITLANPYDSLKSLRTGFIKPIIWYSGTVIWTPGDVMSVSCPIDITRYPFDIQTCRLKMVCWGHSMEQILLITPENKIKLDYYNEHGTWELLETMASNETKNVLSYIHLKLKLKRRSQFYVVNVILPVMFMVVLNMLVFLLPMESGERISFSITVLLALAVFLTLVGDNLPKTSKPMSILSFFLLADLIQSAFICFVTIYGLNVYFRDEKKTPVPNWVKEVIYLTQSPKRKKSDTNRTTSMKVKKSKVDLVKTDVQNADFHWLPQTNAAPEITWKDVSQSLDTAMLCASIVTQIILKSIFFVMTMPT